ncbi:PREDICTED: uncharacterized protein LOC104817962 [Tarenaya hassleriana]|uniref:uncharacterized protein LOC104817962 n=1 Tax=Tarenaya hassleriana TaxID=28532 RepID=UPI00053C1163|nr:PREDICTED: uncharacterized protein LOC104817962 [Tarenaya hassleriana]
MGKDQTVSKKVWNIIRFVLFMLHKGVSKHKLVVDLNVMLKRGKNLMFHSRRRAANANAASAFRPMQPHEYEFSCSNTPNFTFPFHIASKSKRSSLFACAHAPETLEDGAAAARAVFELLNGGNNGNVNANAAVEALTALSPYLPGFGRTPLVRPLRVTDSPFPLREEADMENGHVDKAAEEFIQKFYKNLKLQKKMIEFN